MWLMLEQVRTGKRNPKDSHPCLSDVWFCWLPTYSLTLITSLSISLIFVLLFKCSKCTYRKFVVLFAKEFPNFL